MSGQLTGRARTGAAVASILLGALFIVDWVTVQSPVGAAAKLAGAAILAGASASCAALWVPGIAACATLALALQSLSVFLYWAPPLAFASYLLGLSAPRRQRPWLVAWVLGVSTAGLYAHHLFFDAEWPSGMTTTEAVEAGVGATVLCWLALGFFYLLGAQARQRRERISELEQQVEFAHVRERTQIAREMHDIVAHTLAGITALADGARYAAKSNPEVAQEALETISRESRTALGQIRGLLSVLRSDQTERPAGTAPSRHDFEALFDDARRRGTDLTVEGLDDLPADLPALTQFTLYRVCQEAVTNVLRHASSPVGVIRFVVGAHSIVVEAENAASKSKSSTGGFGLVGIEERVAAVSGRVRFERDGGKFVLTAEVPR